MNASNLDCANLKDLAQGFSLVQACDVLNDGSLRISTPFHYPNGSQIDLFLEKDESLFETYHLSDYGQTANYLLDMHIKPWSTRRRRQMIEDVCRVLGIEQRSGSLRIHLNKELSDFSSAMVRLAQACIRVADLSFTQRLQIVGSFFESVEEFISDAELAYEPNVEIIGKFGNVVKVDFQVQGKHLNSLVQTLSTPTPTNAHAKSTELFVRWYDLIDRRNSNQFVTIYDSTIPAVYREYDLKRLEEVSAVLGFPDEVDATLEVLAA